MYKCQQYPVELIMRYVELSSKYIESHYRNDRMSMLVIALFQFENEKREIEHYWYTGRMNR
jgi:hypothetical protein